LYSSRAIIFTGPSAQSFDATCGTLVFGGQLLADQARDLGIGAQHDGFGVDFGQAACLQVLQVGSELGEFARTAGAVFA